MRSKLTPLNVAATLVLVLAIMSTSWAAPARRLVTGKQIKNSSITSKDVKNGTLTAKDFKKGALKGRVGAKGAPGLAGATGPAGPAGPTGPASAAGAPGAESPSGAAAELWAFRDPQAPGRATFAASFGVPQFAALGADQQGFDDRAVYSFNVDRDHDGAADVRYDFRFTTKVKPATIQRATNTVDSLSDPDLAVSQSYTLTRVTAAGSTTVVTGGNVAPPNLGPRLTPNYSVRLAQPAVAESGAVSAFAGPRKAPTFADASLFDMLGLRPYNPAHLAPLPAENGVDAYKDRNALMIVLRVPITGEGGICPAACASATDPDSVVGVYATTSRDAGGTLVQTSRAGLPLIRELVTPIASRAAWSTTTPADDTDTIARLRDPEIGKLLDLYYPPLIDGPGAPRDQVVDYLARGRGAGLPAGSLLAPNDLLKLNLAVGVTNNPNAGGALAGDAQGFPNGRRFGDDVTDSMLQIFAGRVERPAEAPDNAINDGVAFDASHPLLSAFPYAPVPISVYDQK